jgi:hypothetical protein
MSNVLLTPEEVKKQHPLIYEIFFMGKSAPKPPPKSTRKDGEGLHDYLTRKKIKCFCPACRARV